MRSLTGVSLVTLLVALPLAAQTTSSLVRAETEFPDPFTRLTSIRELAGGKVLATDMQDKIVQLMDFATGTAVKIGREGQGPGEYALPMTLFPLPGDQTWLYDVMGRRFLPIGPDGKVADPVSVPGAGAGPGGFFILGGASGADAGGHLYFQAPPFNPTNPTASAPDSVPILRWDRSGPAYDTVAWVGIPKTSVSASGGGGRVSVRFGGGREFEPAEAWGVAGDGSVARVMPSPYRVLWTPSHGAATAGPVVPYTPLKVTEADKQEVIEQRRRNRGVMIAVGPQGRSASTPNIQIPDPEFADTKPPFSGNNSVLVAPEGEVWVRRNQPAGAKNPLYDVFDRTGKLVRKVTLEPRSRVVGFGKGTVYVVRSDADDLEYLQRFRRP